MKMFAIDAEVYVEMTDICRVTSRCQWDLWEQTSSSGLYHSIVGCAIRSKEDASMPIDAWTVS